jgi:hypothetical protein
MVAEINISGARGIGPMAKAMSIAGLIAGGLIALTFVLDLALGLPFGGRQLVMDIGFILSGAILAYLGWTALREVK